MTNTAAPEPNPNSATDILAALAALMLPDSDELRLDPEGHHHDARVIVVQLTEFLWRSDSLPQLGFEGPDAPIDAAVAMYTSWLELLGLDIINARENLIEWMLEQPLD